MAGNTYKSKYSGEEVDAILDIAKNSISRSVKVYESEIDNLFFDNLTSDISIYEVQSNSEEIIDMSFDPYFIIITTYHEDDTYIGTCQTKLGADGKISRRFYGHITPVQIGWAEWEEYVTTEDVASELSNIINNTILIQNSTGGFNAGFASGAEQGGAVGNCANAGSGGAVGEGTITSDGFAGGKNAVTQAYIEELDGYEPIDAIQLGTGTNENEKTLQVYDYQLMDAEGYIPTERIKIELNEKVTITTEDTATQYTYTAPNEYRLKSFESVVLDWDEPITMEDGEHFEFALFDSDDSSLFSGEIKEGTTELQILYPYNGEDFLGRGFYFDIWFYNPTTDAIRTIESGTVSVSLNFTLENISGFKSPTLMAIIKDLMDRVAALESVEAKLDEALALQENYIGGEDA